MNATQYPSGWHLKYFLALFIFIICMTLGSGLLYLVLYFGGSEAKAQTDLVQLLTQPEHSWKVKTGLALSHIMGFVVSSLIIGSMLGYLQPGSWIKSVKQVKIKDLGWWLILLMMCYPLAGLLGYWSSLVELPSWMTSIDESSMDALENMIAMDNVFQLLGNLVVIAIIPGLGEEMFFRGIIQKHLQNQGMTAFRIIFISAFIFSAFHLQFAGFFPKLLIGWVLAAAFYYTGNLWYSIFIHILNNGLQIIIAYYNPSALQENVSDYKPDLTQVSLILLTVPLIYMIFKYITNHYPHGRSAENPS